MEVSALTGQGIPELRAFIAGKAPAAPSEAGTAAVFTPRQRALLEDALEALEAGSGLAAGIISQVVGKMERGAKWVR
jgi:translation initiation factor IF-2